MASGTNTKRQSAWEVRREREQNWRKHLAAWQQDATSQAEYCRRHNLAQADFSYWKHELARRDGRMKRQVPAPAFVPIKVETAWGADVFDCEVLLKNGRRLRLGATISAQRAAELAAVLESEPSC